MGYAPVLAVKSGLSAVFVVETGVFQLRAMLAVARASLSNDEMRCMHLIPLGVDTLTPADLQPPQPSDVPSDGQPPITPASTEQQRRLVVFEHIEPGLLGDRLLAHVLQLHAANIIRPTDIIFPARVRAHKYVCDADVI